MERFRPGDILRGKYRIEAVLGEGGFGVVYRATTLETERRVAIKLLKQKAGGGYEVEVQRFLREQRAIANLQSPHTVTLFDYGKTESGAPFMVTEYVDGEDLADICRRHGPLPTNLVIAMLLQALDSLAEAHAAGILHRDIKPQNIRVSDAFGPNMRLTVLDFGLVKSFTEEEAPLTRAGRVIGTPRYMSPEQVRGKPLSPAADVFGLGLVAFEMLLGTKHPALKARIPGSGLHISVADPVPADVRAVVNRMLAVDPADRFADTSEVRAALRALDRITAVPPVAAAGPATVRDGATEEVLTAPVSTTIEDVAGPTAPVMGSTAPPSGPPTPARAADSPKARPPGRPLVAVAGFLITSSVVAVAVLSRGESETRSSQLAVAPAPSPGGAGRITFDGSDIDEASAALAEGQSAFKKGAWLQAFEAFRRVELRPDTPQALALREAGLMEQTIAAILALPPQPDTVAALRGLAEAYPADGRIAARIGECEADLAGAERARETLASATFALTETLVNILALGQKLDLTVREPRHEYPKGARDSRWPDFRSRESIHEALARKWGDLLLCGWWDAGRAPVTIDFAINGSGQVHSVRVSSTSELPQRTPACLRRVILLRLEFSPVHILGDYRVTLRLKRPEY